MYYCWLVKSPLLPAATKLWPKVIFLQASVCPQEGVYLVPGEGVLSPRGVSGPGGCVWSGGYGPGVCVVRGGVGGLCMVWGCYTPNPKKFFFDFFLISLGTPPPPEADSGIWSMSGRYASYWNAFLFHLFWLLGDFLRGGRKKKRFKVN